jgi:hypothetical protein
MKLKNEQNLHFKISFSFFKFSVPFIIVIAITSGSLEQVNKSNEIEQIARTVFTTLNFLRKS